MLCLADHQEFTQDAYLAFVCCSVGSCLHPVCPCIQVLLYAANLVGYGRICLLAAAVASGHHRPHTTLTLFLLNFCLDGLDGNLARRLHQVALSADVYASA